MHLLLIDDDTNLLKLLHGPLARYGHTVVDARNGKEGWDVFLQQPERFDAIITDVEMPVCNGLEFLQRLRDKAFDVPVIIMTAHQNIKFSIEGLRLGATDFLIKPFDFDALRDILLKLDAVQANKKKALEGIARFSEDIRIAMTSQTLYIARVVAFLQDRIKPFCEAHKMNARNIGVCLHEAFANAIIHGNLEIPSSLKNESPETFEVLLREREQLLEYGSRQVLIRCQIFATHLSFEIQDQGVGFDIRSVRAPDPELFHPTGRGLLIIMALMDEVHWNDKGNRITMLKYLHSPAQPQT